MKLNVSRRMKILGVANLIAVALLFVTAGSVSAGWETYCPPSALGCDCLMNVPFNPDGCYDNNGEDIICSSNEWCLEHYGPN